jgi:hypothetical protein
MSENYQIICTVNNKVICIDEILSTEENPAEHIRRSMYDLKDRAIREALISEGWTPPVLMPGEGTN